MKYLITIPFLMLTGCVGDSPLAKVNYKIMNQNGEVLLENVVVEEGRCFNVSLPDAGGDGIGVGGGSARVVLSVGEGDASSVQIGSGCPPEE